MTENLVSAMHPELQDRYMQLKDIINSFSLFSLMIIFFLTARPSSSYILIKKNNFADFLVLIGGFP